MIGSISSGCSVTTRKNNASLRSSSPARLMYFERRLQAPEIFEHTLDLFVLARHVRRQQPAQAERLAFLFGERGALVQGGIAQQHAATWEPFRQGRQLARRGYVRARAHGHGD